MQSKRQSRFPSIEEKKLAEKRLNLLMERLAEGAIFVEGKKDREALESMGMNSEKIYTISGNLRSSCEKAARNGVKLAILLTDLDERGEELAEEARSELERYGIKCNSELRKAIAGLLKLRYFEDMKRKYEKFMEEVS